MRDDGTLTGRTASGFEGAPTENTIDDNQVTSTGLGRDDPSVAQLGTTPGFEPSPHLALLIAGTILAPVSFVLVWLLRRRARRWWEYPVGELTSVEPHAPGPGSDP